MEQLYRQATEESLKAYIKFLQSDLIDSEKLKGINAVLKGLDACTRHERNMVANKAINFSIARTLATNKSELEKYIKLSMPELPEVTSHDQPVS